MGGKLVARFSVQPGKRHTTSILVRPSRGQHYRVEVHEQGFAGLPRLLHSIGESRRCVLLTDSRVARIHLPPIKTLLEVAGLDTLELVVQAGERAKSIGEATRLWDRLVAAKVDRKTALIALGGGVVGDLGGFVAATYLRGIPLVHVPTTLLAQVDSAIGGKTAINHRLGKNLIGSFYQPSGVYENVGALTTLGDREFRSGLAEVVKYGLLGDPVLFRLLERNTAAVLARETKILLEVVRRSIKLKAEVVARDEHEQGERAVLNLGHTLGHALENAEGYGRLLHGEAVAIGLAAATRLAQRRSLFSERDSNRTSRLLECFGLPSRRKGVTAKALLPSLTRDKKANGQAIRFVMPRRIGATELMWISADRLAEELAEAAV